MGTIGFTTKYSSLSSAAGVNPLAEVTSIRDKGFTAVQHGQRWHNRLACWIKDSARAFFSPLRKNTPRNTAWDRLSEDFYGDKNINAKKKDFAEMKIKKWRKEGGTLRVSHIKKLLRQLNDNSETLATDVQVVGNQIQSLPPRDGDLLHVTIESTEERLPSPENAPASEQTSTPQETSAPKHTEINYYRSNTSFVPSMSSSGVSDLGHVSALEVERRTSDNYTGWQDQGEKTIRTDTTSSQKQESDAPLHAAQVTKELDGTLTSSTQDSRHAQNTPVPPKDTSEEPFYDASMSSFEDFQDALEPSSSDTTKVDEDQETVIVETEVDNDTVLTDQIKLVADSDLPSKELNSQQMHVLADAMKESVAVPQKTATRPDIKVTTHSNRPETPKLDEVAKKWLADNHDWSQPEIYEATQEVMNDVGFATTARFRSQSNEKTEKRNRNEAASGIMGQFFAEIKGQDSTTMTSGDFKENFRKAVLSYCFDKKDWFDHIGSEMVDTGWDATN